MLHLVRLAGFGAGWKIVLADVQFPTKEEKPALHGVKNCHWRSNLALFDFGSRSSERAPQRVGLVLIGQKRNLMEKCKTVVS